VELAEPVEIDWAFRSARRRLPPPRRRRALLTIDRIRSGQPVAAWRAGSSGLGAALRVRFAPGERGHERDAALSDGAPAGVRPGRRGPGPSVDPVVPARAHRGHPLASVRWCSGRSTAGSPASGARRAESSEPGSWRRTDRVPPAPLRRGTGWEFQVRLARRGRPPGQRPGRPASRRTGHFPRWPTGTSGGRLRASLRVTWKKIGCGSRERSADLWTAPWPCEGS